MEKNTDTISLGGNIALSGFNNIEKAKLFVIRKIVGNYVKQLMEKRNDYEKLDITLEGDETNPKLKVEASFAGNPITEESSGTNLFVTLNECLNRILEKA